MNDWEKNFFTGRNAANLRWIWNKALELLIEYQQFRYYEFMLKNAAKEKINMNGILRCRLRLNKKRAWASPTCEIAIIKNGVYTPIPPKMLPEEPTLLSHYPENKARPKNPDLFMTLTGYLTKTRCDLMREEEDSRRRLINKDRVEKGQPKLKLLGELTVPSSWMKGTVFNRLVAAWEAYLNPKIEKACMPNFKKNEMLPSFHCISPEQIWFDGDRLRLPGKWVDGEGKQHPLSLRFVNKNHERIPEEVRSTPGAIRAVTIKEEPTGWYVCIVSAHPLEVKIRKLEAQLKKTPEFVEKELLKQQISDLKAELSIQVRKKAKIKPRKRGIAVHTGLINLMSSDEPGSHVKNPRFAAKQARKLARIERKLARQRSDRKKLIKERQEQGLSVDHLRGDSNNYKKTLHRKGKINETKIRRPANAFLHKSSTILVRRFGKITIEEMPTDEMVKRPDPIPSADGKGYEPNGAEHQSDLNREILDARWGRYRSLVEEKCRRFRGPDSFTLSPSPYSSQICHCCGELGRHPKALEFYCLNERCKLYQIQQNADTNAAQNDYYGAFCDEKDIKHYEWFSHITRTDKPVPPESLEGVDSKKRTIKKTRKAVKPKTAKTKRIKPIVVKT